MRHDRHSSLRHLRHERGTRPHRRAHHRLPHHLRRPMVVRMSARPDAAPSLSGRVLPASVRTRVRAPWERLVNRELAATARQSADQAGTATLTRKAWLCVGIALHHTKTITGARRVLTQEVRLDDVRAAALEALDELTKGDQP